MRRDYRLHELTDTEFESLAVQVCIRWLGEGVTPFAPGKDGGRDGKFQGRANCFPSEAMPLEGHCVLQSKHVAAADRSCSDRDFASLLKEEHSKIKRLVSEKICDHYIVFTNRKYTGGADEKYMKDLLSLGLQSAHIVGNERLHLALNNSQSLRDMLPNRYDVSPFRFEPDDLVNVISALGDYTHDGLSSAFDSARDFDKIKIEGKNTINGVSQNYYQQCIVADSMPHFERVRQFLLNPRNSSYADLYHDAADELKQKIIARRDEFHNFDDVFVFLFDGIQQKKLELKGRRRLISILLHYMYCNCDIGSKRLSAVEVAANANS